MEAASKLARLAMERYYAINLQLKRELEPTPQVKARIEDFSDNDCWNFFETKKTDLYRMMRGLRFNRDFTLDNHWTVSGEEVSARAA